jgi:hypothetical protein
MLPLVSKGQTGKELLSESKKASTFLISIYKEYINCNLTTTSNNCSMDKHLSPELKIKIKKADLDYDPIVNAQDYLPEWLDSINIFQPNLRALKFTVNLDKTTQIDLALIKKEEIYLISNLRIKN